MRNVLMIIVCLCLAACHCPISNNDVMRANFGQKPTNEEAAYKARKHFEQVLIDPDSLKLGCSQEIKKGWTREYQCGPATLGYLVLCNVNAKNRYGGYTGNKLFAVIINGTGVSAINLNEFPNREMNRGWFVGYTE